MNNIQEKMEKFLKIKSKTEDNRRNELILNIILLFSITMFSLIEIMVIHQSLKHGLKYNGIGVIEITFILVVFSYLYYLSRAGYLKIASYLLVTIYFIAVTIGSYYFGVSLPSILLTYALIITIATVLINSKFGFAVSLATLLVMLIIGGYEMSHPKSIEWKEHPLIFGDIITYGFLLIMITVISWLSNRETERSLKRARKSEAELTIERDSLEIKVEQRTRELKQAHIEKITQLSRFAEFGKLSSGLFHDLMGPLSSISLNIKDLNKHSHADVKGIDEQLSNVIKASQKMDKFLSSVRKQIRTDSFHEDFCINEIIEEVISLLRHKSLKSNVDIIFEQTHKIYTYGNPIKFHHVISNLVSNAIDAYDEYPIEQEKKIYISLKESENVINISVKDRGVGINPDVLPKIFDQFFTTKPTDKGTGLGLYMTKEMVEKKFNGDIKATSDSKLGTVFTIKIPVKNVIDKNKQNNI